MNVNPFHNTLKEYRQLLEAGSSLEVIDRYYAEGIIQQENEEPVFSGKAVIRAQEEQNLSRTQFFSVRIPNLLADEVKGLVMGEMEIRWANHKGERFLLREAFVQHWQHFQIGYQKFYYKNIIRVQ